MLDGATITLRGTEYVVPSLSFAEVRRFKADGTLDKLPWNGAAILAALEPGGPGYERMDAAVTVVYAALKWNYPDITRETVDAALDLGNLETAMAAVLGASGLLRKKDSPSGEKAGP